MPRTFLDESLSALTGRPAALEPNLPELPSGAGLYAFHGAPDVWLALGLGDPPDGRPLYVGKSESSLVTRDLEIHLGIENVTGWSSPRRSLAALLHDSLGLRGIPRDKGTRYANFGMAAHDEQVLSAWMRRRLGLTSWAKPQDFAGDLENLEVAVLQSLSPPLNLKGVETPWRAPIKTLRLIMAKEARAAAATGEAVRGTSG